ncbi:MAG: homing endonuclease associated repeat-containing protein [Promethearchaeota archaeon]
MIRKYKEPNEAQRDALLKIEEFKKKGINFNLVSIPSGGGKTIFSALETENIKGNILYIAHRNEILDQAKEVFKKIHKLKNEDIGVCNSERKELDKKITFATIQTISKKKHLYNIDSKQFEYLIVDEYHHSATETYRRVLKYLKPKYILGLTATPFRMDGKKLDEFVCKELAYELSTKKGIEMKILSSFIYRGEFDDVDYSDIKCNGFKYSQKDLNKKLIIDKRDEKIIQEFKKYIGDKKTMAFCCSIEHVASCVRKFEEAGISSVGITYKDKKEIRKSKMDNFRKGIYQVVFTVDLFNEGVDVPDVEGIMFLRPTFSETVFIQQLGRGLRTNEGKKYAVILDFIGNQKNADMARKILNEIVSTGEGQRTQKPQLNYLVPKVSFDSRVLDIFQMQEDWIITKEKLTDNYWNVKKELGRQPISTDMNKYGKYCKGAYQRYFGSWNKFLEEIGEPILENTNITKEKLTDNYWEVKKKLGKQPIGKTISRYGKYCANSYDRYFGSYNKFLESIGEPLIKKHLTNITKENLTDNYFEVKKKLGKQLISKDMNKYGKYSYNYYLKYFGSWNKFLESIGEPIIRDINITKKKLIENYWKVKKEIGRQPISTDMNKYSYNSYKKHFGSWNEFLESIGEPILKSRNITKEKLIENYWKVKKEIGRQPISTDMNKYGKYSRRSYQRYYDSWNNVKKEIESIFKKRD